MPDSYSLDAGRAGVRPALDDPASLDRLAKYLRNMDQVIVSCPEHERGKWSQLLKGAGIHAEVVSPLAREIGALEIKHYRRPDIFTLVVSTGKMRLRDRALKRAFDLGASALALNNLEKLYLCLRDLGAVEASATRSRQCTLAMSAQNL